jgi:hypothetical protein
MGGPTAPGQFRSGTTVHNVKSFYAFILVSLTDLVIGLKEWTLPSHFA